MAKVAQEKQQSKLNSFVLLIHTQEDGYQWQEVETDETAQRLLQHAHIAQVVDVDSKEAEQIKKEHSERVTVVT